MGLRGDFGKLRSLINRMRDVAAGKLERAESQLMQECKAATQLEVVECFFYQRDPSGRPWAARITVYGDYRDTNPILYDLLSSLEFTVDNGTVHVTSKKHYAFFHQTGTSRMVARAFLPSRSSPGKLFARLRIASVRALRAALTGRDASEGYYASYELSGR